MDDKFVIETFENRKGDRHMESELNTSYTPADSKKLAKMAAERYENNMMETVAEAQDMMRSSAEKFLHDSPMWMRVNYIWATLSKVLQNGETEADINWKRVTEVLTKDIDQYDFNIIDPVGSMADLMDIRERITAAQVMAALPWKRGNCRDCGKLFYMTASETNFYHDKGLQTPKRCSDCRKKRKGQAVKKITNLASAD